jgi:aromatic-L-amino-acid/L-tryptophan decarboxylase
MAERPSPMRELDWDPERARDIGERMLDLWVELLERLRALPVARMERAPDVAAAMELPIPEEGLAPAEIARLLRPLLFEHSVYAGHPGHLSYITGAGTVPGAAADLLAAGLNANVGGWMLSPGASELEAHLMRWLAERFGLPSGSGGLMTSGGAASNLTALKVARDTASPGDARRDGIAGARPAIYCSSEAHATIAEAADVLGLGEAAVRRIETDEALRMRVDQLEEAIAADRAAGVRPAAVVGTAGTTGTGAIDPLPELARIAHREEAWFHVDASYGGAVVFAPGLRPLLAGIELADSIAFDPHKWLSTPQSSAALLVRDPAALLRSFSGRDVAYVREDVELTGTGQNFGGLGPQWSRAFWALKVWVSLAAHGTGAYGRRIAHDVELARYLEARAREHPSLEPMAPATLSIACFRYVPPGLPRTPERDAYLDRLNERLMVEIRRDGRTFPSNAEIGGRYALRACITNFRTEAEDLEALVEAAVSLGERSDEELRPEDLRG